MKFIIFGNPIAQKRPRFGLRCVYDPDRTEKIKMKLLFKAQMNREGYHKVIGSPIEVKMNIYVQIPKSVSKSKQTALENVFHTGARPGDCDNIFKFYSDVMNSVVYDDDRQICKLSVEKRYSARPRVEIEVNILEEK